MKKFLFHAYLAVQLASPICAVLQYATSTDGFDYPARGWNSWALQANNHQLELSSTSVFEQCSAMAALMNTGKLTHNFTYCSIDSGWSPDVGDECGRIVNNKVTFPNMTTLAQNLGSIDLRLGIYVKPGFFQVDKDKQICGADGATLWSIAYEPENYTFEHRYQMDYNNPNAQKYCDSNVAQFASWGVDYIKLDHVTPGTKGTGLPHNNSGIAKCYHQAIVNSKRQMWLALSPRLDLSEDYWKVWSASADSLRLAGDINHVSDNPNDTSLVEWPTIQRTMAYLRAFLRSRDVNEKLHIRPDLDPLLIGNDRALNNLTANQRLTTLAHYVSSGANLILGSDMTKIDDFGKQWLTNPQVWDTADFSAVYPVRPVGMFKEPALSEGIKGEQFQIYVAGPNDNGEAILMATNYGDTGDNSYYTTPIKGIIKYTITAAMFKDFGLDKGCYSAFDVFKSTTQLVTQVRVELGDSETALFRMTPGSGCQILSDEL